MSPRPLFNRALLIAIVIGVISFLGLSCSLLTRVRDQSTISPTVLPSSMSSHEVETLTPAPSATSTHDEVSLTATVKGPNAVTHLPTETHRSTSTLVTNTLPPPSATYTPVHIQPLGVGKYDDIDPNILYDPYWSALKNPGTKNAYRGTLHASSGIGNEASFRFTGKRFRLGYQRGRNFGTVTVIIDDEQYSFHEQAFDLLWRSPELSPGDHFVRIIHDSGESINLDYVEILD